MNSLNTFLPRMRTLDEAYAAIVALDPQTCISKNYIRKLALTNQIPVVMSGRKRLLSLDGIFEFLNNGSPVAEESETKKPGIRRVEL